LYWARGSMFSKQEAYSSKDTTFLPWRINQAIWNVKKSRNLGITKWVGHYRDLTWNHTQTLLQQVLLFQWQQWVDSRIWGEAKKQGGGRHNWQHHLKKSERFWISLTLQRWELSQYR
jgi:hypothetical protein